MNALLQTALIRAADGDLAEVLDLLAAGADPSGMPLLMAIQCREPQIVAALLAAGANPNGIVPSTLTTPLIRAVTAADPEIVQPLLAAGADPNLPRPDGTPPHQALHGQLRLNVTDAERDQMYQLLAAADAGRGG